MRRFWSSVAARARKLRAFLAFTILFIVQQLFEDQLVAFVKWAANQFGMTPTAALLFAVSNPLVAFFGAIGVTLVGIFLLAWRDIRRHPAADSPVTTPILVSVASPTPEPPAIVPHLEALDATALYVTPDGYGGYSEASGHPGFDFTSALVAVFRHDPATPPAEVVRARITFLDGVEVKQRVHYGCWLGEAVNFTEFEPTDTRSLLVVLLRSPYCVAVDDKRKDAGVGGGLSERIVEFFDIPELTAVVELTIMNGNFVFLGQQLFRYRVSIDRETGFDIRLA